MTFGEDWGWGASKEESRRIFDLFAEAGGNFVDTANNYTNGTSERFLGQPRVGRLTGRGHGGSARLGAAGGSPGPVQLGRPRRGTGAAAHGTQPGPGRRRVGTARGRGADREVHLRLR